MSYRDVLKKAMYAFESGSYAAQTAAIAAIEAELAKPEPEQEPLPDEQIKTAATSRQRMCPNTYYECGRGCGDGPCKDFYDDNDIKG